MVGFINFSSFTPFCWTERRPKILSVASHRRSNILTWVWTEALVAAGHGKAAAVGHVYRLSRAGKRLT